MAGMTIAPAVLGFAVIFALAKADLGSFAWGDWLMMGGFILLLGWLSLPRSDKPAAHEEASQGVAFRLGKALNRIRGGGRRRA